MDGALLDKEEEDREEIERSSESLKSWEMVRATDLGYDWKRRTGKRQREREEYVKFAVTNKKGVRRYGRVLRWSFSSRYVRKTVYGTSMRRRYFDIQERYAYRTAFRFRKLKSRQIFSTEFVPFDLSTNHVRGIAS